MKPILAAALSALGLVGCAVCAEDYANYNGDYPGYSEREDYVAAQPRFLPKPPTVERLSLPASASPERPSKSQSQ